MLNFIVSFFVSERFADSIFFTCFNIQSSGKNKSIVFLVMEFIIQPFIYLLYLPENYRWYHIWTKKFYFRSFIGFIIGLLLFFGTFMFFNVVDNRFHYLFETAINIIGVSIIFSIVILLLIVNPIVTATLFVLILLGIVIHIVFKNIVFGNGRNSRIRTHVS